MRFSWALVVGALLLGSCKPGAVTHANSRPTKPRIALIMKSLANEFFQTMEASAKRHHGEHAGEYDLITDGIKNETDLTEQVGLVEQMTAQGVQAIVIAPADSKALVPALKRAQDAGALIINIDNKLDADAERDADLRAPFVGPDNRAGARLAGDAAAARLKAGDKAAIIEGVPAAFNAQQRTAGFVDAMKAAGIEIVSTQSGNWEMDPANGVASALLTAHPDLKAILCGNDTMALGAVAAAQASGRHPVIVGFDDIAAVRPMIADGRVLATVNQHADQLAVFGIEAALGILRGEAKPENRTTAVDLVTADH